MAIIQHITSHGQFADAFMRMGRGDQFSYSALGALFDFYDDFEGDVELDPIAICCNWSEYDNYLDAATDYGFEPDSDMDEDEREDAAMDWLNDRTVVLTPDNGSVVVESF